MYERLVSRCNTTMAPFTSLTLKYWDVFTSMAHRHMPLNGLATRCSKGNYTCCWAYIAYWTPFSFLPRTILKWLSLKAISVKCRVVQKKRQKDLKCFPSKFYLYLQQLWKELRLIFINARKTHRSISLVNVISISFCKIRCLIFSSCKKEMRKPVLHSVFAEIVTNNYHVRDLWYGQCKL